MESEKETLFKQNYKFIDFKKPTDQSNNSGSGLNIESVKEFYQNLINSEKTFSNDKSQEERKPDLPLPSPAQPTFNIKIDSKELLKAAQNNDLSLVKAYSNSGSDLLVLDSYKWNALMISIASFNNQIVEHLLTKTEDLEVVKSLLSDKDLSGNTAESLAVKFLNQEALGLIHNFNKAYTEKQNESVENTDKEIIETEDFYCENCNKVFNSQDESHYEHITSIVHQLNQNEQDETRIKKMLANYHLRPNNKGYQLMLKSGWRESGLGLNEQGQVNPVRTQIKLDRYGIGIKKLSSSETPKDSSGNPISARSTKIFKLKSNKSGKDTTKSLKEILKKIQK